MKSTPLTQGIAMLVLVIYVLYSFFVLPFAGFLLSMAVGLVSYGGLESFEMSVSLMIITGVMYSLIAKSSERDATARLTTTRPRVEPFNDINTIAKRVQSIQKQQQPSGIFASSFVEGFANAAADPEDPNGSGSTIVSTGTGGPASTSETGGAGSDMDGPMPPPSITTSGPKKEEEDEISGFTGTQNKKGEFKLGVLPEETKGGYHIDQGTTVMNALNALKPDQIKAMSADTQKLIDTQKSLMSMLSTMKPMLQDGQQMMNNFQEMFGKSGGQFKLA
jgi:hypothetical protein